MDFDLSGFPKEADELATRCARRTKQKNRQQAQEHLAGLWEGKALHGKHPKRMKHADEDLHRTNQSLTSSGLKAETEELIIAAQDQSLATRLYHSNFIKDSTDPLCRMCGKFDESPTTSYLSAQNMPKRNTIKGTITQHHTSIGRCTRAITSRQVTNGTSTNQKLS